MTKGRPPYLALKESRAIAGRQGKISQNTKGRGLLYDFLLHFMLVTVAIRVKRTRKVVTEMDQILSLCRREIAGLRRVPSSAVFVRELWVRSPIGTWQFFLVLDDTIVEMPAELLPGNRSGARPVKEEAPGPDRSGLQGGAPPAIRGLVCPFMAAVK